MENDYTYETVPDGIWQATYTGFETTEFTDKKTGKPNRCVRHLWEVDVEGRLVKANCLSDMTPTPHNRFGKIFKAFVGRDIKPLERAPIEKWAGTKATLVFETRDGRSTITNILPAKV